MLNVLNFSIGIAESVYTKLGGVSKMLIIFYTLRAKILMMNSHVILLFLFYSWTSLDSIQWIPY